MNLAGRAVSLQESALVSDRLPRERERGGGGRYSHRTLKQAVALKAANVIHAAHKISCYRSTINRRQSHCATSTDSQRSTGQNKHHERRPPGLMGGASAKHAPAVTPIITEDSNPLSDRGRHLPSPPFQAQATITREDHPGLWAEQAPTMLHQSSLKTRTFCPTMQPSCILTTDTTGTGM